MGGVAFILAAILALLVSGGLLSKELPILFWRPLLFSFLYALANAAVGMLDDLTKFRKAQNEGLTPTEKLILQFTFSAAYIALLRIYGYIDTSLYIPFVNTVVELGYGYYIFAILLSTGVVNFVNLSDGIDGLASTTSLIVSAFFVAMATYLSEATALLTATATMGACLGFLLFNRHPAKIFMGDTGSLFLGAMLVGCAFLLGNPLIVLVAGGVYLLEGASVILQVGWFKISGKRLFRMAPFHHHLEKCNWSETKIVLLFALLSLIGAVLAAFGIGG